MEKKPSVFPQSTSGQTKSPVATTKEEAIQEVYNNVTAESQLDAVAQMKKRTEEQLKLRDEMLKKNEAQISTYQQMSETINKSPLTTTVEPPQSLTKVKQPETVSEVKKTQLNMNAYIESISQPQYNAAFDLIPLPSEGKTYKGKRPNVKVSYLTTSDENILTSPNLLASGQFLEILINRKLLEQDLRFKDLLIGDRNAIMIWLRATSYGHMYPVTLLDEKETPFQTEINLHDLKYKKLGAEPDAEGLFEYNFNLCKKTIKFKLLTVGDVDDIESMLEVDRLNEVPINFESTYVLQKQIVEVDGRRDNDYINAFVDNLRAGDASDFREYVVKIESGVDLNINVGTPGGGSIETFLPLNINFFWPKFRI